MVSSTDVGGANTPTGKANRNKNKPKPKPAQAPRFNGSATTDSVLHGKVITSGPGQDAQLLTLTTIIPTYVAERKYAGWAESIRTNTRKLEDEFLPNRIRKDTYGTFVNGVFVWNAPAMNTEEDYAHDLMMLKTAQQAGQKNYDDYKNDGEFLYLAIQGQVETCVWDKTIADVRYAAVEASKCPIQLLDLLRDRATGTNSGVWPPMACMNQLQKSVGLLQNPKWGGTTSVGEYKRLVENGVNSTMRLGGKCAYGTAIMIPFLTANGQTLATYFAMTPAQQAPYDILYKDMIVTVIMVKNCGYESVRAFLSQQFMSPAAHPYPTVSNNLVDMLNSEHFPPDAFKPVNGKNKNRNRNRNKNKKDDKDDELVGAIVQPQETGPAAPNEEPEPSDDDDSIDDDPDDCDPAVEDNEDESIDDSVPESVPRSEDEECESDDEDSVGDESDDDYSVDDGRDNIDNVFALINANDYEECFDPEAEEERQYSDLQEALASNEIVGCVTEVTEEVITYDMDDYDHLPHTDPMFNDCRGGWQGDNPMIHEKMEMDHKYFCGSDYSKQQTRPRLTPRKQIPYNM